MTKKQWAQSISLIFAGTVLFGLSYSIFLEPSHFTGGGLSGVALIIYHLSGNVLSPGITTFVLNIPLFFLAFKNVGKRYFILSVIGMTLYTLAIEITMYFQADLLNFFGNPHKDLMLSAVIAGLLGGLGTGFVVRAGGSTGGSDLIGGLINRKRPNLSVGNVMMVFDLSIVALNSIVEGAFNVALYSIVSIIIVTVVIDFFIDGFKECRAYYIISEKYEEISAEVLKKLHRGATSLPARGMYTKQEKNMILVLIKKRQQTELRNIIKRMDPNAFIFAISAKDVLGQGFNALDPKEKPEPKHEHKQIEKPTEEKTNDNVDQRNNTSGT